MSPARQKRTLTPLTRCSLDMIPRCDELSLRLKTSKEHAKLNFLVPLTVQTMNYLTVGRYRLSL
jgi:hypothetical protein